MRPDHNVRSVAIVTRAYNHRRHNMDEFRAYINGRPHKRLDYNTLMYYSRQANRTYDLADPRFVHIATSVLNIIERDNYLPCPQLSNIVKAHHDQLSDPSIARDLPA